jgi:3'-phosphoadenosine 5'-phosphosulfate sulfotransferase (PAPS reductase)/FAD synthetase
MNEELKEVQSENDWLTDEGFDLSVLNNNAPEPGAITHQVIEAGQQVAIDPLAYARILIAFSGGKDSLALVLHMIELGVPRDRIELHHHLVDGREGSTLMDWPITESYCEAIAKALGVQLTFSWRAGGLEREMLRDGDPTAPVFIPEGDGHRAIGGKGPEGTRLKFPQVSADLSVRWCSGVSKIDVFARYLNNHPKFNEGTTLVLTGERAEESSARSKYKVFEKHRCDLREGRKVQRHIDVWRAVHGWSEQQVWDIIKRFSLVAHPSYFLGFSRCSCRTCIFGSKDQWATIREIAPAQFNQVAGYEREFKVTIHRKDSIVQRADEGTPYATDPFWVELANSQHFSRSVYMDPWVLPAGAFGEGCGPT